MVVKYLTKAILFLEMPLFEKKCLFSDKLLGARLRIENQIHEPPAELIYPSLLFLQLKKAYVPYLQGNPQCFRAENGICCYFSIFFTFKVGKD